FSNLTENDAASYTCTIRDVTNPNTSITTDPATLRVREPITFTQHPQGASVYVGDLVQFSAAATGGYTPLTYQWRWKGIDIQGSNSPAYAAVANAQFPGIFTCAVSDATGTTVVSSPAPLAVYTRIVI